MMQARYMSMNQLTRRLRAADLLVEEVIPDVSVSGITDDSRNVSAGDLFCAWSGSSVDAHAFVGSAAQAGAAAALVEHAVSDVDIPQIVVRDGRRAAAIAASVFFAEPEHSLRLIAVTGTNGKTTTKDLLRAVLSPKYRVNATKGNFNNLVGAPLRQAASRAGAR